jgi:nucleotide-binding universal stress UspA family protein
MPSQDAPSGAKILVATDLSAPADEAIRQGHEMAAKLGAELVICHVIPTQHRANPLFPQRNEGDATAVVALEQRVAELVTSRVSEITGRSPDGFRVTIDLGKPEAGILNAAMNRNVDLVVLGNRGDTGVARILLGGVSERVVQYAHCSVLVVRPAPKRGTVLAATDLSDASFPALTAGATQARQRGAKLVVMHNLDLWPPPVSSAGLALASAGLPTSPAIVQEQSALAMRQLREVLARLGIEATCKVTHGPPDAEIIKLAEDLEPELLVIGTHGRTGLARLALGSIAERVVATASCSVLVVRMGEH